MSNRALASIGTLLLLTASTGCSLVVRPDLSRLGDGSTDSTIVDAPPRDVPPGTDVPIGPDVPIEVDIPILPDVPVPTDMGCTCGQFMACCSGLTCADLRVDLENCGSCGVRCADVSPTATCRNGACLDDCAPGTGDCNMDPRDGCETRLNNTGNCGACGNVCRASGGATPVCTEGRCDIMCPTNTLNCDGNVDNGCEVRRGTAENCNSCGDTCDPTSGGACLPLMIGGFGCCRRVSSSTCSSTCMGMCRTGGGQTFCCSR